jgi:hypothetical protein
MRFLKELMMNGPIKTRKDFQRELLSYNDFYGVTGWTAFDQQGEVVKDPHLLTVSGQHLRLLP